MFQKRGAIERILASIIAVELGVAVGELEVGEIPSGWSIGRRVCAGIH